MQVRARPLAGYALLRAREEGRTLAVLNALLRRSVIYITFLLILLVVNHATFPGHVGFLMRHDVAQLFEKQPCSDGRSFSAIKRHAAHCDIRCIDIS